MSTEPTGTDDLPLFRDSRPAIKAGRSALRETAARHEAEIQRLIPLALELARRAHPDPITVSDLRLYAVQRGLLTGDETGRELSWLGAVMPRAGLEATGEWRRSSIVKSHGNLQQTWRLPNGRK